MIFPIQLGGIDITQDVVKHYQLQIWKFQQELLKDTHACLIVNNAFCLPCRGPIARCQAIEMFGTLSHVRNGLQRFSNRIVFTTIDRLACFFREVYNPSLN